MLSAPQDFTKFGFRTGSRIGSEFVVSYENLEHALSLERFSRYLAWAGDDRARAIELYTLNTKAL
jgi:hypothetical protein